MLTSFSAIMSAYGGAMLVVLGAALAAGLPCVGSGFGCGYAGQAATGLLSEDPSQFSKCLILQVIPGTQGLYGTVTAFFALMRAGVLSGVAMSDIPLDLGMRVFAACIPMALGGWLTALSQGKVAAASVNIVSKQPNDWSKGMILCITVEFYAILSLLMSFLMLLNVA